MTSGAAQSRGGPPPFASLQPARPPPLNGYATAPSRPSQGAPPLPAAARDPAPANAAKLSGIGERGHPAVSPAVYPAPSLPARNSTLRPEQNPAPDPAASVAELIGFLYAAVNTVRRKGAGADEIAVLLQRVHDVAAFVEGGQPPAEKPAPPAAADAAAPPKRSVGCQAAFGNLRAAPPPSLTSPATATVPPVAAGFAAAAAGQGQGQGSGRRRPKLSKKHPVFLQLGCAACSVRMSKARWQALPGKVQRELAWIQRDADAVLLDSRRRAAEVVRGSCSCCAASPACNAVADPIPPHRRPVRLKLLSPADIARREQKARLRRKPPEDVSDSDDPTNPPAKATPRRHPDAIAELRKRAQASRPVLAARPTPIQPLPVAAAPAAPAAAPLGGVGPGPPGNGSFVGSTLSSSVVSPILSQNALAPTSAKDREDDPSFEHLKLRPAWADSNEWPVCGALGCTVRFGWVARKHHCRYCGYVFCDQHAKQRVSLPELGYTTRLHRVCDKCFELTDTTWKRP
ncbi:Vacuolar protein sorting-associated protein 27 [Diplonema papillatum]|nr:Vacuolar protein sorting-associated protein 27 [Diplonema papillatum]